MQSLQTSKIAPAQLDELKSFADSNASPELRDLLLNLIDSIREGDEIFIAENNEAISPSKAAKLLGMSRTHLYKLLDRGDIPFDHVGRDRRIRLRDLAEFESRRRADRFELAERFAHQHQTAAGADAEIGDLL